MSRPGCLVGLVALLLVALQPSLARAEFGILPGSGEVSVLDAEGHPEVRAGAHPDLMTIKFGLNTVKGRSADGNAKDIVFELPPGLIGDLNAVPACPRSTFDAGLAGKECLDAQLGKATLEVPGLPIRMSIYNVEPGPHEMGTLGGAVDGIRMPISVQLGGAGQGTTMKLANLFEVSLEGIEMELWGVPADHQSEPAGPRLPFLTLPSRCGAPIELAVRVDSWQAPGVYHGTEMNTGANLTGCDSQHFEPTIAFSMANVAADTPSGARVDVVQPEDGTADGRASAQIRDAAIALPDGVTLSPAAVAGLAVCSDAQFGLGSETAAACPPGSEVGSAEISSPLLRDPIAGKLYMGQELPGARFRVLLDAAGPGVEIKLVGRLDVDPATGRLTVALTDLPQIPLERLTLSFAGGPRAPLVTPLDCASLAASAHFDSYGDASRDVSSPAQERSAPACSAATAFKPVFVAGAPEVRAGRKTPLAITVSRQDGEQPLTQIVARLPRGITPALGTVESCEPSAAASGGCPPDSRIGSAVAEVGSGSEPVTLPGSIYLTGHYRRAPFGFLMTFRAKLGSFDMGTLAVRGGMTMNPRTGRATLETATLPQLVEGVPIRFRTVGLDIDRPGFIRNPTSCEAESFEATIVAAGGASSDAASPFQVRGCGRLRFRPTIAMALRGAKRLHRHGKPGLGLVLRSPSASANLRGVRIPFPRRITLNPTGPDEICARPEAIGGDCPAGSVVGVTLARSPLSKRWLKGSLYVVQPAGDGLPDLWADVGERGFHLMVRGTTSVAKGHLTTHFTRMPDVAVRTLRMRFYGGKKGVFTLRQGLCRRVDPASMLSRVAFEGQDDAFRPVRVKLRYPRCRGAGATGRTRG